MDDACKIATLIIAVTSHTVLAVPFSIDFIVFRIFIAFTHAQIVFHGSNKLFRGITVDGLLVLTIDDYIIAFFRVILYPTFLVTTLTPSVYTACLLSFSLILPVESLTIPVGLRHHKMVFIFNMCGLAHGICDTNHVTRLVITILYERLISVSISRQEYHSSYLWAIIILKAQLSSCSISYFFQLSCLILELYYMPGHIPDRRKPPSASFRTADP